MNQKTSKRAAELKVVGKYRQLYGPLMDLVKALQALEPGGTLVDDIVLMGGAEGQATRVAYTAHPVMLTIQEKNRAFILRVVGTE